MPTVKASKSTLTLLGIFSLAYTVATFKEGVEEAFQKSSKNRLLL